MKIIYCEKCGAVLVKLTKGEVRKNTKMYCGECVEDMMPKADLPPGFEELFGGFRK